MLIIKCFDLIGDIGQVRVFLPTADFAVIQSEDGILYAILGAAIIALTGGVALPADAAFLRPPGRDRPGIIRAAMGSGFGAQGLFHLGLRLKGQRLEGQDFNDAPHPACCLGRLEQAG